MCGIAGFIGIHDPELVYRMSALLAHRGPDDSDVFYEHESGLGLVHRRLSIVGIDERGREPIWNEDRTIALVFNGEIYNYPELRKSLSQHTFYSDMDGEVLLHLYEDYGTEFLDRLNGMFAFVIWDSRKNLLWGARDHLGIKPLYYALFNGGLVFASEIKGVLAAPAEVVPRTIDLKALGAHLQYIWCPTPATMLSGVKKLRPGHYFTYQDGQFREQKWWDLKIPYPVEAGRSLESWAEELWQVFRQSVKRQLMADVPLGAFLSGGIDSSAIVAAMRELNPGDDLYCYSMKVAGPRTLDNFSDDLTYARSVAHWLDVDLREVEASHSFIAGLDALIWHLEEPIADSAPFFLRAICKQAKADGVKVLLAGVGGDDLFSGYRRHQALYILERLGGAPSSVLRALGGLVAALGSASGKMRRLRKFLSLMALAPSDRVRASFEWIPRELVLSLVPDLANYPTIDPLSDSLAAVSGEPSLLHQQLYLEAKHFLGDHNLVYSDKLSMAEGVEVRVPFLDREMLALAARMPEQVKIDLFSAKRVLKQAVSTKVPPSILHRSKAGFGGPMRDWVVGPLRPLIEDMLGSLDSGLFDKQSLKSLWARTLTNQGDFAYLIFGVFMVERWQKIFLKSFDGLGRTVATARAAG